MRRTIGLATAAAVIAGGALALRAQQDANQDTNQPDARNNPSTAATNSETHEEAVALLRRSAEAVKEVEAASYQFKTVPLGALEGQVPKLDGTVKVVRKGAPQDALTSFTGNLTMPEGAPEESGKVDFASDGDKVAVILHARKEFLHGEIGTGGEQLLGIAEMVVLNPYINETPFEVELNQAQSLSLDGSREVDSVQCDVVVADYGPQSGKVRWFIGHDDHLPRGYEHEMANPVTNESGGISLLATDLKAVEPFDAATFELTQPEGYAAEEVKMPGRAQTLSEGEAAPTWALKTPEGEEVSLEGLKGNVVVMDFWATWCGPCKAAMPALQDLHEKYEGKPVKILGVNVWEEGDPAAYMQENEFTYPLLLEGDQVATTYGVNAIPTFYVIDQDGKIIHVSTGFNPKAEEALSKIIDDALAKQSTESDEG